MKKFISILLCLAMILATMPAIVMAAESITISNEQDFIEFSNAVNSGRNVDAELTADITLGEEYAIISSTEELAYNGKFNGNGHKIKFIQSNALDLYSSLFGYIGSNGTVENLVIEGSLIGKNVAAVAYVNNGEIYNVESDMILSGSETACGIAVTNNNKITYCFNKGKVSTETGKVAGIAIANTGAVLNCVNNGIISGDTFDKQEMWSEAAAGIVNNNNGTISGCNNVAKVSGGAYVAGIASDNKGTVSMCQNSGNIKTYTNYAGGIVASNSGIIEG